MNARLNARSLVHLAALAVLGISRPRQLEWPRGRRYAIVVGRDA